MSRASADLVARQAELRRRCAEQRERLAAAGQGIASGLERVDRRLAVVARWGSNPLVIAAGVGLLVLLGRSRSLRWLSAGVGTATTALRIVAPLLQRRRAREGHEPAG